MHHAGAPAVPRSEQSVLVRVRRCGGAAGHAELGEDVLEVPADGVAADDQLGRDLAVGPPPSDERQDLTLPGREQPGAGRPPTAAEAAPTASARSGAAPRAANVSRANESCRVAWRSSPSARRARATSTAARPALVRHPQPAPGLHRRLDAGARPRGRPGRAGGSPAARRPSPAGPPTAPGPRADRARRQPPSPRPDRPAPERRRRPRRAGVDAATRSRSRARCGAAVREVGTSPRQLEQRQPGLGWMAAPIRLDVLGVGPLVVTAQAEQLGPLIVGQAEGRMRWVGQPPARVLDGILRLVPAARGLGDLGAVHEALSPVRDQLRLRVAPRAEGVGPLRRGPGADRRSPCTPGSPRNRRSRR